jgi:aromatic ring-opening dioxygenase catalytic subunit (LigB family)
MSLTHQNTSSARMPTWFIPHGAGPCFFMDWNPRDAWHKTGKFLKDLPSTLPAKPKAILMISAHWMQPTISLTGAQNPDLIYDYQGFPSHTYDLQYPAKGDPILAQEIIETLVGSQIKAKIDATRGFDHGMFIPLLLMFPNADIPVIQLSLHNNLDPKTHFNLGVALEKFRDQGVLIIGSGMSFHNMRGYGQPAFGPISDEFDDWLGKVVESDPAKRNQDLIDWANGPSARLCHPLGQEEHLLPLMVVVGAASKEKGYKVFTDRVLETSISAFVFR